MNKALDNLKNDHSDFGKNILLDNLPSNPFELFNIWFEQAHEGEDIEVNASCLSTINNKTKQPSSRIIYLKEIESNSFVFYTNYNSQKGREIEDNPNACMLFFWPHQQRQIIINGNIEKINPEKSDEYFSSRPRSSQIGAWASKQSEFINSREDLLNSFNLIEKQFGNSEIPRPLHWGGYALSPYAFEFWQGRPSRFHDRINYISSDDKWIIKRKNP